MVHIPAKTLSYVGITGISAVLFVQTIMRDSLYCKAWYLNSFAILTL